MNINIFDINYLKVQYPSKKKSEFPLHYLIVNETNKKIKKFISRNSKDGKFIFLTKPDENFHNATPMLLAVLTKKKKIAFKLIIACKINEKALNDCLNSSLKSGWSPLLIAKITSISIFDLLLSRGANSQTRTNLGAGVTDISEMLSREVKSVSSSKVVWVADDGKKTKMSELESTGKLEKITKLKGYRDIPYIPPFDTSYTQLILYEGIKGDP